MGEGKKVDLPNSLNSKRYSQRARKTKRIRIATPAGPQEQN